MQKHKKRMCCNSASCLVLALNYTTWHIETETAPVSLWTFQHLTAKRKSLMGFHACIISFRFAYIIITRSLNMYHHD